MVAAVNAKADDDPAQPAPEVHAEPAVPAAEETPAPAGEHQAEDDGYVFDEDGFVGARDLAAQIDANPALKAALDPDTRNTIMANARRAERLAPYEEIFASPEEAKIVSQTAQTHAGFVEAFNLLATDPAKGTDEVVRKLIEAGARRDEEGNILKDEHGRPKTNGIAGRLFDQLFQRGLTNKIIKKVEALGDEAVTAALDLVMERVGLRPSTAGEDQHQDPAIAAERTALAAERAEIARQRESQTQEQKKQYSDSLNAEFASIYEAETGKLLTLATGLDPLTKTSVEQRLEKDIRAAIRRNTAYQMRKDQLEAMPMGPKRRSEEVALAREFFRDNLVRIARPILAEAGIKLKGKAGERDAQQAARADAARSEVAGGRAQQPGAGRPQNPAQAREQAVEAFKAANGGREPDDSELNIALMMSAARRANLAA